MENKEKIYTLLAFPYPSGSGLHMGHAYSYGIMDSYCRAFRHRGYEVFQPMGFDTHGLPTELYAQKVGRESQEVATENIQNFKSQLNKMNTQYQLRFSTSDESYVKWTQWIFTKLYDNNLAYKKFGEVNWCPSCKTALANEQVKEDHCERCSSKIEKKEMNQWYFRITEYKDRLIKNLEFLDFPESTKKVQRNWLDNLRDWSIGRQRKFGAQIPIEGETDTMDSFVDSSFYFIRYCDPDNQFELCSKEKYKQVDLYCCGAELATNHLIYARFIHMFLYDIDVVPVEEPFKRIFHNGLILYNGEKMSKSRGNVVDPSDYDSDIMRFYLCFLAPFSDGANWSDQNIVGIQRFINRFKEWMSREGSDEIDVNKFKETIFKYNDSFKFNKIVSEFMILLNSNKKYNLKPDVKENIISLIEIYMPGIRNKLAS
jgi:leucyl-tRNA synthetase